MGYERAKTEEMVHYKQKDYRKYDRLHLDYAYPMGALKFDDETIKIHRDYINEGDDIAISKFWLSINTL